MRLFFFLSVITLCLLSLPVKADSSKLIDAGRPDPVVIPVDEDSFKYVDIHARRILYRESAREFREALSERRENFATYRRAALERYNPRQ